MAKQISDNEIYLLIKYIKSVFWRVVKCLSYIEDARCLKVNTHTPLSTLSLLFTCSLLNSVAKQLVLGGEKIEESSGGLLQSSNGP